MTERHGLFITFEGMDASGKSTQMSLLAERLQRDGYRVLITIEPGGTRIGDQIRAILLNREHQEMSPTAEMLLYFASRAQNVDERIVPALDAGEIVLSDRYTDSTLAYQGIARGLGKDTVLALHKVACRGLDPDLTILIDLDFETSQQRKRARSETERAADRMDDQAAGFHRRVREGYLELAREYPGRYRVIDGSGDRDSIAAAVWNAVEPKLFPRS